MPFPAFIYFKNAPTQTSPHPSVSVRYLHYSIKMRRLILYVCMFICMYELSRSCHRSSSPLPSFLYYNTFKVFVQDFLCEVLLRKPCKNFRTCYKEKEKRSSGIHAKSYCCADAILMFSGILPRIRQRRGRQEANAGRIFSTGRPRRCAFSRSYVTRVSSSMNARSLSLALAQLTLYFLHILKNIS